MKGCKRTEVNRLLDRDGEGARGNVTGESYSGGLTGAHTGYASTGQVKQKKWSSGATVLDQLDYSYDSFGDLHTRANTLAGAMASESYAYDGLQRLIQAARSGVPGNPQVTYGYAAKGNSSCKSDFSDFTKLFGPGSPHTPPQPNE